MKQLDDSVDIAAIKLRKMPKLPDGKYLFHDVQILGTFDCCANFLASLEGCPTSVEVDFDCAGNDELLNLQGGPVEVGRSYYCNDCGLISLDGAPSRIKASFICSENKLSSLRGAPVKIGMDFNCSNNPLKSLEGCPEEIGGNFYAFNTSLSKMDIQKKCKVIGEIYTS